MKTEKIMVQDLESDYRLQMEEPEPKLQKKTKLKLIKGYKTGSKIKAVIWIVLIFAAFFTIITRYSQMTNLNYEIADLKESLTVQGAENSALGVELDKMTNMMKVRHIAETELGMQEPAKYQITYINVPRANTSEAAAGPEEPGDNTIGILEYLKGFIFGRQ